MKKLPLKKWTILMQISAENNLFTDMLRVMEELFSIGESEAGGFEQVNFLVLFDGIEAKKFSSDFARPALYLVRPGTSFFVEYPEYPLYSDDLTNPAILKHVYGFVKKNYPAKKYGFIYKGHGSHGEGDVASYVYKERIMKVPVTYMKPANYEKLDDLLKKKALFFKGGWKVADFYPINSYRSLNNKETYLMVILSRKGGRMLTYRAMAYVLESVFGKSKLDFVFLDCCWGMQIENAYTFRNLANYFIASADLMPAAGVGYDDFLRKVMSRPDIRDREVANLLLSVFFTNKYDDYDNDDDPSFKKMGVSLSNLNMGELDPFLETFDQLCTVLGSDIDKYAPLVKKVRDCCEDHTYNATPTEFQMYNIDLIWFLENMVYFNKHFLKDQELERICLELLYLLSVRLRYGFMGNNYKKLQPGTRSIGGNGITITFPENMKQFRKSMFKPQSEVAPEFIADTKWKFFLDAYYRHISRLRKGETLLKAYVDRIRKEKSLARMMDVSTASSREIRNGVNRFFKSVVS